MDTWYGDRGHSSLIDYICCPRTITVQSAGPLAGLGRNLQLITTKQNKDHLPLHLNFEMAAGPPTATAVPLQWCRDSMMDAYTGRDPHTKQLFFEKVEEFMTRYIEHYYQCLDLELPDRLFEQLETTLRDAGQAVFSKAPPRDDRYETLRLHRHALLEERQRLRQHVATVSDEEVEIVTKELRRLPTHLQRERKQEWIIYQTELIEEMWRAWKERRMAQVHALARRAAGTKYGVKRRPFLAIKMNGLSTQQWMESWGLPGCDGGMKAQPMEDWFRDRRQRLNMTATVEGLDEDFRREAKGDLRRLTWWARKGPKRKSSSPWSTPLELLAILLAPECHPEKQIAGIGTELPPREATLFRAALEDGLVKFDSPSGPRLFGM